MNKIDIIREILNKKIHIPINEMGRAFAPTNIALIKYWGKRDNALNLPITSSLSISLPQKGAQSEITVSHENDHRIYVNDVAISNESPHGKRLNEFLNAFRFGTFSYDVRIHVNIPVAAGLASSSCIYASLILALNDLYQWNLDTSTLSILARLGSGSACRSIYSGFVEWHVGTCPKGLDSFATPIDAPWPDFCVGLCVIDSSPKTLSSREGMIHTLKTSRLYAEWPNCVKTDLLHMKKALKNRDFSLMGKTAESNALTFHATLLSAWPPISYHKPQTFDLMHRVWSCRQRGIEMYFTQDAGPNLKLLFLKNQLDSVFAEFPDMEIIRPFEQIT